MEDTPVRENPPQRPTTISTKSTLINQQTLNLKSIDSVTSTPVNDKSSVCSVIDQQPTTLQKEIALDRHAKKPRPKNVPINNGCDHQMHTVKHEDARSFDPEFLDQEDYDRLGYLGDVDQIVLKQQLDHWEMYNEGESLSGMESRLVDVPFRITANDENGQVLGVVKEYARLECMFQFKLQFRFDVFLSSQK